jgi:hypothetical protein
MKFAPNRLFGPPYLLDEVMADPARCHHGAQDLPDA